MLRAHGLTDKGQVRPTNEDAFGIVPELGLCVVADGMGGHKAGEVASRLAVDATMGWVRRSSTDTWPFGFDPEVSLAGNLLRTAVHVANKRVFDLSSTMPDYEGMGTTIVAVVVRNGLLSIAHAGDSRLYLYGAGRLQQMTDDDSWLATVLSRDPHADPVALRQHPMRHALTNVVGARAAMTVTLREQALNGRERLALTTDGVHGVLEDARVADLLAKGDDMQRIAADMIDSALASGSRDNCTAVVAEYLPECSS